MLFYLSLAFVAAIPVGNHVIVREYSREEQELFGKRTRMRPVGTLVLDLASGIQWADAEIFKSDTSYRIGTGSNLPLEPRQDLTITSERRAKVLACLVARIGFEQTETSLLLEEVPMPG